MQVMRFRQVSAELVAEHTRRLSADEIKPQPATSSLHDVVTLASIIEKETSIDSERAMVSAVFHNRLRRGMRLQADPTVIYGLAVAGKKWTGEALHTHLREPGPYNTYTSDGLPPGPICNPGRDSLSAALFPADTDVLYFVATGNGSHSFSSTLSAHNRAVAQLRKRQPDG
jgi:UPF0755 protein